MANFGWTLPLFSLKFNFSLKFWVSWNSCHLVFYADVPTEKPDPCHPSPCGANAICKERNGAGSCQCLPEFSGDPYTGCRPECVLNSECPQEKACINNKCVNPCIGICGSYAECRVINHAPSCTCAIGYVGNPLVACHPEPKPARKQSSSLFCLFKFCLGLCGRGSLISPRKRRCEVSWHK